MSDKEFKGHIMIDSGYTHSEENRWGCSLSYDLYQSQDGNIFASYGGEDDDWYIEYNSLEEAIADGFWKPA